MNHSLPWTTRAESSSRARRLRRALAWLLQRGAASLDRLAAALAVEVAAPATPSEVEPWLEFHACGAAPEGALYVDGHLVGTLPGVTRL